MASERPLDNSISLVGEGGQEFLSTFYDYLFTLDYSYTLTISPKSVFWNFGIHFSNQSDFGFNKESLLSKETATLFLTAGETNPSSNVKLPTVLKLSQINVSNGPAIIRQFDSSTSGDIILTVKYLSTEGLLYINVKTTLEVSDHVFEMRPYQFFKMVAWGEWEPFDIVCEINRLPLINNLQDQPINYYFIKLREETWNTRSFQPGMLANFNSYLEPNKKRPEYNLFEKLKIGDKLIGYECESDQEIVCVFSVTAPIATDNTEVAMQIERCIQPPIPLAHFRQKINFTPQLNNVIVTRLFELNKTQFDQLLTPRPINNPHTSILTSFTSDDPNQTKDQLAFTYDILSFATIIALKKVKPPLAIGLFGNWGSGKSFFMEQLENEIKAKIKSPGDIFVQNVVQVKFNSWHYSDANLWASLITEIFDQLYAYASERGKISELTKLSETLQISNLQKTVAEIKKQELEKRQLKLQQEEADKRAELKDISGIDMVKLILKDPKVQEDLKAFDNENIKKIFEDENKVNEWIAEVESDSNKWIYFFKTWFSLRGRWNYVIPAVLILFVGSLLVRYVPAITHIWQTFTAKLVAFVAVVLPLIKSAWKAYQPVRERFNIALTRLRSLRKTIAARKHKELPELEENEKHIQSVKESIDALNKKIEDTEKALDDIRSGRKLLEFIEQRSRDEQYARQLGLISWIRKDFKKLDELLREFYQVEDEDKRREMNPSNVKLRIDRIVLYIDDLDRCNEEIVVNVLEAVHLLLAFQLFVVVVGVDPRWLNKSLTKKYPFFSNNGQKKKSRDADVDSKSNNDVEEDLAPISSFDYLEKIFQIPFALKPITKEGREGLIGYLVEDETDRNEESTLANTGHTTLQTAQTNSGTNNEIQPEQLEGTNVETEQSSTAVEPKIINITGTAIGVTSVDATLTALKALKLSQEEVNYMKDVSILFGHTPRTIKRFVNIYRLIKSHRGLDPDTDFKATLLVLALVIGCPEHAQTFIFELEKSNHAKFGELLNEFALTGLKSWILTQLKNAPIPKLWREQSIPSLQANQELISRFSFRTYAM